MSGRAIAASTIALLGTCLIVGYLLYAGRVAARWGDDWTAFGPSPSQSGWVALVDWYMNSNGRVGNGLLLALVRTPLDLPRFGPDDFPWWLILSLSAFCAVATPFNLVLAASRLARKCFSSWELIAAAGAATVIWTIGPATYSTTTYPVLLTFTAAVYAASLALLLYVWQPNDRRTLVTAGSLYVFASLSFEQLLTSLPVLFGAAAVSMSWRRAARDVLRARGPMVGAEHGLRDHVLHRAWAGQAGRAPPRSGK